MKRLQSADILRGLAAFAVMWFHFTKDGTGAAYPPDGFLKWSGSFGDLGVDAFFVISGLVIPLSLAQRGYSLREQGWTFFVRRMVRLEPPYLVAAGLALALIYLSALTPGFRGAWPDEGVLRDAMLHPLYLVPWFGGDWLVGAFWTLAIEFQYYLLMIFTGQILLSPKKTWRYLFLAAALVGPLITTDRRLVFYFMPLFAVGFVHFLKITGRMNATEYAVGLTLASIVLGMTLGIDDVVTVLLSVAFLSLPISQGWRPLAFLGTISYSLYLLHQPIGERVMNLFHRFPDTTLFSLLGLAAAICVSIAAATFLWFFVERPSLQKARTMGRPKTLVLSPT